MYRMTLAAVAAALALGSASRALADEASRLADAAKVVQGIRGEIDQDIWNKARCVAVIPNLKKAAFIVGGEYGKGMVSCRSGSAWSPPLFMQLAKGSWGFQAGAEEVDLVPLVMNESGVDKLLGNKTTLGADASVAAGPIGRRAAAGTDAALTAEIISYSRSKGLFAGIDLSGGVLRPDEDANRAVYGKSATPRNILASREISAPPSASAFIRALGSAAPASPPPAPPPAPASASAPPAPERRADSAPAGDESVRAQLVDVQQTLDRMLADSTPSAVGTSGDRSGGTVTIERARLMQIRRQIESLITTLNKR